MKRSATILTVAAAAMGAAAFLPAGVAAQPGPPASVPAQALLQCQAALSTCNGDLSTCNSDLSTANSDLSTCNAALDACENPVCGNGQQEAGEQCDDTDDAACPANCQADCQCPLATCGDGVRNHTSEECDGSDDAACPGGCQADCLCPPAPECPCWTVEDVRQSAEESCELCMEQNTALLISSQPSETFFAATSTALNLASCEVTGGPSMDLLSPEAVEGCFDILETELGPCDVVFGCVSLP